MELLTEDVLIDLLLSLSFPFHLLLFCRLFGLFDLLFYSVFITFDRSFGILFSLEGEEIPDALFRPGENIERKQCDVAAALLHAIFIELESKHLVVVREEVLNDSGECHLDFFITVVPLSRDRLVRSALVGLKDFVRIVPKLNFGNMLDGSGHILR